MRICYLILTLLFFSIFSVYAVSSEEKIDYISKIIFEDCQGKDIDFNSNADAQGLIISRKAPRGTTTERKPITILKWPYNLDSIKEIIYELDKYSWFELYNGGILGNGLYGKNILNCGDNRLDISKDDYYWKSIKLDLPVNIKNVEKPFIKIGEISFSIFGGITIISIFSLSIIAISIKLFISYIKKRKKLSFKKFELIFKQKE